MRTCKGAIVSHLHSFKHKGEKVQEKSLICHLLPEEVLANIFSFVESSKVCDLKLTCKKFNRISGDPSIKSLMISHVCGNLPENFVTAIRELPLSEFHTGLRYNILGLSLIIKNPGLLDNLTEEEEISLKKTPLFENLFPLD